MSPRAQLVFTVFCFLFNVHVLYVVPFGVMKNNNMASMRRAASSIDRLQYVHAGTEA